MNEKNINEARELHSRYIKDFHLVLADSSPFPVTDRMPNNVSLSDPRGVTSQEQKPPQKLDPKSQSPGTFSYLESSPQRGPTDDGSLTQDEREALRQLQIIRSNTRGGSRFDMDVVRELGIPDWRYQYILLIEQNYYRSRRAAQARAFTGFQQESCSPGDEQYQAAGVNNTQEYRATGFGYKEPSQNQEHDESHVESQQKRLHACWVPLCYQKFSHDSQLDTHLKAHGERGGCNRYVTTLDENTQDYDPDFRGQLTPDGRPIYGSKLEDPTVT